MAFGSVFGRPFVATFDPRASAAAAAANWWEAGGAPTAVWVYQPKNAASLAASYVNLVNPGTYDAAPGTAPSWSSAGWAFNGIDQYLTTGATPGTDWSTLICYEDASIGDGHLIGYYEGASTRFSIEVVTSLIVYENGGRLVVSVPSPTSGVLGFAGNVAYRNGSSETGTIDGWGSGATSDPYIGARHRADIASVDMFQPATIKAAAAWSTSTGHATWMPAVMAAVALI